MLQHCKVALVGGTVNDDDDGDEGDNEGGSEVTLGMDAFGRRRCS